MRLKENPNRVVMNLFHEKQMKTIKKIQALKPCDSSISFSSSAWYENPENLFSNPLKFDPPSEFPYSIFFFLLVMIVVSICCICLRRLIWRVLSNYIEQKKT
ncbi:unnamed protein product, partial [marine sediment metagenome]